MHKIVNAFEKFGFVPAWDDAPHKTIMERYLFHSPITELHESLLAVPGLPNYLPPLIPADKDQWLPRVRELVALSFYSLIADIWTQLLIQKRDSKEKPMYIFWDDDVPKPNELSSLAWLLLCETWPMPNHRSITNGVQLFPPQSFVLPQCIPLPFASQQPTGFARCSWSNTGHLSLSRMFAECLTRDDREKMALVKDRQIIFRPSAAIATGFGFHKLPGFEMTYNNQPQWAWTPSQLADHGYAATESADSYNHNSALSQLRADVMHFVGFMPSMPTHKDTLFNAPGMHLRVLNEVGMSLINLQPELWWTSKHETVKLEHGIVLQHVPQASPRVWFGFTHIGPDLSKNDNESATTRWATAYLKARHTALTMLFAPHLFERELEIARSTERRENLLRKHGRLKNSTANASFAAAFAQLTKQKKED